MSEWIETTVGELAATTRNALVGGPFGSNLVSKDYVDHGVPVIRGQNMGARWVAGDFAYVSPEKAQALSANTARPGDIIFTQRGTLGQVALVPNEPFETYVVSQSQMKLTVDPAKADSLFLYYLFSSPVQQEYIRQNAIQVGVPHTNLGILRDTPVVIPVSVDAQKDIARHLGTLDDKIELNRRMNETLEAMARAIFQSWFVDFDPVRAKASGESTGSICCRLGLTPELLALFPDSFEDSELGEIPMDWSVTNLSEFCELNAKSWSAKTLPDEVHYVDLANTKNGVIQDVQALARAEAPSRAKRILRPGDTVIGTVRPGNRSFALIGSRDIQLTGSTGFAVLSPNESYLTEIVYLVSTADDNIDRLARLADGGAYPAVSPELILETRCVRPRSEIFKVFHEVASSLMRVFEANTLANIALANARDELLPKLLSGELGVLEVSAQ